MHVLLRNFKRREIINIYEKIFIVYCILCIVCVSMKCAVPNSWKGIGKWKLLSTLARPCDHQSSQ